MATPRKKPEDLQKAGRPVEAIPQELADSVICWIRTGQTLAEWGRTPGNPSRQTIYDWCDKDPEFAVRFGRAREVGFDAIADDTLRIVDTSPERVDTQFGDKVDAGHVQWQKNRVEQRMKLLAKWDPRRYGDKIEHEHKGGITVTMSKDDLSVV